LALWQGDYPVAGEYLKESIALYRALGEERGRADALLLAGFLARVEEKYGIARGFLEEALALSRAIGHRFITAASLHHLGMMAEDADQDHAEARRLLEESLGLYHSLGLPRFIGLVSCSLGDVARAEGNYRRAYSLLHEGITQMAEVDRERAKASPLGLDALAHLLMDDGLAERAVRLAGSSAHLRDTGSGFGWPAASRSRERWLAVAREALGNDEFTNAWQAGQTMTPAETTAYALDQVATRISCC
jgi:tetratricopeptide (TPR) repeat protein